MRNISKRKDNIYIVKPVKQLYSGHNMLLSKTFTNKIKRKSHFPIASSYLIEGTFFSVSSINIKIIKER